MMARMASSSLRLMLHQHREKKDLFFLVAPSKVLVEAPIDLPWLTHLFCHQFVRLTLN